METPLRSIHETWGKRDYIEGWSSRMEWQRPLREMQMAMVNLMIPHPPEASIRILDLAAGYGALSSLLLEARPHATAVCLDVSEEMLTMGRERTASFGNRIEFVQGSLEGPEWLKSTKGNFDIVVSSRALHHFSANQRRRAIYSEIYGLLRTGGCFINADNMRAATESLRQRYRRASDQWLGKYVEEKTEGQKTLAEVKKETEIPAHSTHDNGLLDQELAWLREIGFADVDCFWKFGNYAVYGGFR
jgi:tRNA (cmo5U34)-methyltransferase